MNKLNVLSSYQLWLGSEEGTRRGDPTLPSDNADLAQFVIGRGNTAELTLSLTRGSRQVCPYESQK